MEEDINLLLSYIETEVREGRRPLVGGGVVVNGEQILKLVKRIRVALESATGEEKIKEATQKANEIIQLANERKQRIIDEDIATREAKVKAERIIQNAIFEKNKKEQELKQNLNYLLAGVKTTLEEANKAVEEAMNGATKSLDSAITRVNKKTTQD